MGRAQKVRAFADHMINELVLLPHSLQRKTFSEVSDLLSGRLPPDVLALFAPTAAADTGSVSNESTAPAAADSLEDLQVLLQTTAAQPEREWAGAWSALGIAPSGHAEALANLLQAQHLALSDNPDLAPRLMAELARAKAVSTAAVEEALTALGPGLEEIIAENECAWHFHAYVLLYFFPKTASSNWGLQLPGWTWTTWWGMLERVLAPVDGSRAFDILVMALQQMQERSGRAVKHLQVFQQGGDGNRVRMLRAALCRWSDMDDATILETLAAYGVEF